MNSKNERGRAEAKETRPPEPSGVGVGVRAAGRGVRLVSGAAP